MDIAEIYQRSVNSFSERVHQVHASQWSAPTPCSEWDVRTLVNHVVGEERWTTPIMTGATIEEVGDRFDGDLLGDDPIKNTDDAAHEAAMVVNEPGAMDRTVHLSFGDVPALEYIQQLLADHLIHSWDLAVAIGVDPQLDPAAVSATTEWFANREEAYRQAGAIGPRVPLAEDASGQDKLIAAFGRDPDWSVPMT